MSARAATDGPAVDYARGIAGGLIGGMPLLYTMEVWWLGETARPGHVLAVLALAALPVGLLVLAAGFRRDERPTLGAAVADTFTALALGVTTCGVVLVALDELEIATSPVTAMSTVVVQAAPFALGVAVATQVFRTDDPDDGDAGDDVGAGDSPGWATVRDLAATAAGALFLGLAIAPTEEIPMIASGLDPTDAAALVLVSGGLEFRRLARAELVRVSEIDRTAAPPRWSCPRRHLRTRCASTGAEASRRPVPRWPSCNAGIMSG